MSDMCMPRPSRHLTVGYFRKRHEDRKTKIPTRYSVHAALSLKGDWLEEAGFKTHSRVRVLVEQGKLVIELIADEAG
ncbi:MULTISPECIES: SymE family type I addiction module toxin [Leclercia]|uniref:SymE family type I addiction module toxin n=1 Tax=Leclercia TaxID=83654 RepID=UPI00321B4E92